MEYKAIFIDAKGIRRWRKFFANHSYHAMRKAVGISKSQGWTVIEVGKL